jgi:hypothetical protein
MLDNVVFGYDYAATPCCSVYNDAYLAQWRRFVTLCQDVHAAEESANATQSRLDGYVKSFTAIHNARLALQLVDS